MTGHAGRSARTGRRDRLPPLALAYHGVASVGLRHDPHRLFVAPGLLRRHIGRLRAWGYELVTFSELARRLGRSDGAATAALTFDDGFADNAHALGPLLAALDVPATVFVIAGLLGRAHPDVPTARLMTADEVRGLARQGVEIGSHTMWHRDLAALDESAARADLSESRRTLQNLVDQPVDVAAYPFGSATGTSRRACREAGFRAACRTEGLGSWLDQWDLPRQSMGNASTVTGLRLKRAHVYEPLMATAPGRAARRARLVARRALTGRHG